ncbi:MAG: hypothetical protein EBU52_15145, partial [Cytophagia bacterium]|nr:hypothetical protein [Cytophagia bacterium]
MKKLNQKFSLVLIICVILILDCYSQAFVSNPGIPNPTITFLSDSVVRLDYDSIYHVHEWWDTIQYPQAIGNIRNTVTGKYDYDRIFSDLMTVLDASQYHFIPIYGDDDLRYGEIPGWIHSGERNFFPAKNIGFDNNLYTGLPMKPIRGSNYLMPHMNDIKTLDRPNTNELASMPNFGSTLFLFHEIGHTWLTYWRTGAAGVLGWTSIGWQPWMPTSMLVSAGQHWFPWFSDRWVNPTNAGIMPSAPSFYEFNIFDLYTMGIRTYNQTADSILYVRNPETLIEYPLNVDSLIATLNKAQNYLDTTPPDSIPDYLEVQEFMEGD